MTRKVATVLRAKSCISAALLQIMFSMLTAEKFRHAQVCPDKVPLPGKARGGIWAPSRQMVPWAHPSPRPKENFDKFDL